MSDPAALLRTGVRIIAGGPDVRSAQLTCRERRHATGSAGKSRCTDVRGTLDESRSWKRIGQTKSS